VMTPAPGARFGPGARLGPYEIAAPIGAGGMGEVYRARDTRLGRDVAIKVLPAHLSGDPARRERFEREARVISSLNHPHICTLYDVGRQASAEGPVEFLVMELVEGESLADRLARGPLPIDALLRHAGEIADALERAHRGGVVHRDLKPGNVMLTKAGAKLLDFGLARSTGAAGSVGSGARGGAGEADEAGRAGGPDAGESSLSRSPTMTRALTTDGAIIGTFQYMAPEQLEGREADARTDIFAFGALLYEMATGRRAFEGKSQASLIAAIMERQPPPIATVAPVAPPALERVVRQCLAKDPDDRWQSAGDLKRELRWIAAAGAAESGGAVGAAAGATAGATAAGATHAAARGPMARFGRLWPVALAGWLVAGLTLAALGMIVARRAVGPTGSAGAGEIRFAIAPPRGTTFENLLSDADYAVSPEGRRIVFRGRDGAGAVRLYLRPLESLEPVMLAGTEDARQPFWSPDGREIGFFARGRLMRVSVAGGAVAAVCDYEGNVMSGAWSAGGDILFTVSGGPLMRVPEKGGAPVSIQTPDPARHESGLRGVRVLPDGRHFLVTGFSPRAEERTLYLGSLDGGAAVPLMKTPFKAEYVEPGYLLHVRGSALVAQPFRSSPPALAGDPVVVIDAIDIATIPSFSSFSASPNGTIAWTTGQRDVVRTRMAWFDRAGRRVGEVGAPASDVGVSLSPDGTKAAVARVSGSGLSAGGEPATNLWVIDLQRGIDTRLTLDPVNGDENPVWSPDGRRIAFARHVRGNEAEVYEVSAAGGDERALIPSSSNTHPVDWSPDGTTLLVHVGDDNGSQSLASVRLDGDRVPVPFLATRFDEGQGQFSPDGRFVAYTSSESGTAEVYVRPFPTGTDRWQVSSKGGGEPRWRADGRELFYMAADGGLMAVEVGTSPVFTAGTPVALFPTGLRPAGFWYYGGLGAYVPSRDGQRFLINTIAAARAPTPINVLLNWRPPAPR